MNRFWRIVFLIYVAFAIAGSLLHGLRNYLLTESFASAAGTTLGWLLAWGIFLGAARLLGPRLNSTARISVTAGFIILAVAGPFSLLLQFAHHPVNAAGSAQAQAGTNSASATKFDWDKEAVPMDCTPEQTALWDKSEHDRIAHLDPATIRKAEADKKDPHWFDQFPKICSKRNYAARFPGAR